MARKVLVIINPTSGRGEADLQVINDALTSAGVVYRVMRTQAFGDAEKFAKEAAAEGYDVVAIYGGDGSVMEAASGLRDTQTALAILPGGTANVMSVELGIPNTLTEAIKLLIGEASEIREIDMGVCNGDRLFILRVAIGVEADMVSNADREMKNRFGILAYWVAAVNSFSQAKTVTYHLEVDGETHTVEGISCAVANSANVGQPGLSLIPNYHVSDGFLDAIIIRRADLGGLISSAATVLQGAENQDLITHFQGKHIRVRAEPAQQMQVDGEIIEGDVADVRVLENALRVLVPKTTAPTSDTVKPV